MNNATTITSTTTALDIITNTAPSELFTFWRNSYTSGDRYYVIDALKDALGSKVVSTDAYLELRTSPEGVERAGWREDFYNALTSEESLALNTAFNAWRAEIAATKASADAVTTTTTVTIQFLVKDEVQTEVQVEVSAPVLRQLSIEVLPLRKVSETVFAKKSRKEFSAEAIAEVISSLS